MRRKRRAARRRPPSGGPQFNVKTLAGYEAQSFIRVRLLRSPIPNSTITRFNICVWFVGLDVHAETTVVSVRSSRGIVVKRTVVPTTVAALRRVLSRVRGRVRVVCEVGPLAGWVAKNLQTELREVVVCDRRRTRLLVRSNSKTDRIDADGLSESLRVGAIHPVFVP